MRLVSIVFLICFVHTAYSRDFYMGMFRKNDFLVAADELHKPRAPSRFTWAQYGRIFKCPITYFRVVNRLGTNVMPRVEILKGGLKMKYIVVRLSVYNKPISVNIYVGCENKKKFVFPKRTQATPAAADNATGPGKKDEKGTDDTTVAGDTGGTGAGGTGKGDGTTAAGGEGGDTTAAAEEPAAEGEERRMEGDGRNK